MSLFLSRLSLGKASLVRRSSILLLSNGFSSTSSMLKQTPPCTIIGAVPYGVGVSQGGKLVISNANGGGDSTHLEKRVDYELLSSARSTFSSVVIGLSHGWVATLKDDGVFRLQDDLNPYASYTHPKRIPLPPLFPLPRCQAQFVTNVAMSSSSPEDRDCVVAVKFLGPQLSFCRPARKTPKWVNVRIKSHCFYSSRVMFSKKDNVFRIPCSGGHLIESWDLDPDSPSPSLEKLRFRNVPKVTKARRELLDSCSASQLLVESEPTGETFLVKRYRKTERVKDGMAKMRTRALMVFRLDGEGNAVYTQDIGDLVMFISKSEPFCVLASSFPGLASNYVHILDSDEVGFVHLPDSFLYTVIATFGGPFFISPQDILD
ncbi:unnamed protein product [Microthlaspi erraticum]|uniref:KIB1-4 beta-propeller domain-containing protein n=1 Tax=Microthlaspi erraticum TaxID=1685480 RepID=A0A6D2JYA4_9BRAS|nr:unnamed protein product [Microthlaspi erraticum]